MNFFKRINNIDLPSVNLKDKIELEKIQSDIDYMSSKWGIYISSSLNADIDEFSKWSLDNDVKSSSENRFWTLCSLHSDKFKLYKNGNRFKTLVLMINYKFDTKTFNFTLENLSVDCNIKIPLTKDIESIVYKYYYTVISNRKKAEFKYAKNSLESMLEIIGKDIVRDSKIDDILNTI